jgi:hypothetical protein
MVPPRKKKSSGIPELYRIAMHCQYSKAKLLDSAIELLKKGAPHDIRQAGILNLGFKAVAFRAHQALPDGTRTTALL